MSKKYSYKVISLGFIVLGAVLIVLAIVGYTNISKLGVTGAQYDAIRHSYLGIMSGGSATSSGNTTIDMLMDNRGELLIYGIISILLGIVGAFYFSRHPDKDKGVTIAGNKKPSATSQATQTAQNYSVPMMQPPQMSAVPGQTTAVMETPGLRKVAMIIVAIATVLFALGISIFPYSLFSIAAGACLIYTLWKKDDVTTFFMLLTVGLFMARFVFGDNSFRGYDWITVLYRVVGYSEFVLIAAIDVGEIRTFELEDDDIHLFSKILLCLSAVNTILATIELFRGNGFAIIVFRAGSILFWLGCAMFFFYANKPPFPHKEDIYAGRQPHPFHTISGSVRTFMIGIYIAAAICLLAGPLIVSAFLNTTRQVAISNVQGLVTVTALSGFIVWTMILVGGVLSIAGLFLLWINRKLRLRRPIFLLYYEYACFIMVLTSVVSIFCIRPIVAIIASVIAIALSYFTLKWLTTSVRFRTYMGSDQYLKKGIFTKKLPSPIPADMPAAAQPQAAQSFAPMNTVHASMSPMRQSIPMASGMPNSVPQIGRQNPQVNDDSEWEMVEAPRVDNRWMWQEACCICGNPLHNGHAVIFVYPNGAEARVDEPCWNLLNDLVNANDPAITQGAVQYASSRLPYVDTEVAGYLQQRINYANSTLGINMANTFPQRRM